MIIVSFKETPLLFTVESDLLLLIFLLHLVFRSYSSPFCGLSILASIVIRWVPGQEGIVGNEKADTKAKEAAYSSPAMSLPFLDITYQQVKPQLITRAWYWYHTLQLIYKNPTSVEIKPESSAHVAPDGTCVHYLHKIQPANTEMCSVCKWTNKMVIHFLLHCLVHERARWKLVNTPGQGGHGISNLLFHPKATPHPPISMTPEDHHTFMDELVPQQNKPTTI